MTLANMNVDSVAASIKSKLASIAQNEGKVALVTLKTFFGAHKANIASAYRAVIAGTEATIHKELETNVGQLFLTEGKFTKNLKNLTRTPKL